MDNFRDCTSDLEDDSSFYNSDESCDWSDYSHDYHCSKCSKPRADFESRNEASHRALDRMKFVSAEQSRLNLLSDEKLMMEFKNKFGVRGKKIDRQEKIIRLMKKFVSANRPDKTYRLANKFFDTLILEWTEKHNDPMEPEIEDVVDEIIFNLRHFSANFSRFRDKLVAALKSDKETKDEKVKQVSRLFNVSLSLCSMQTCDQMKTIRTLCSELGFNSD